MDVPVTIRNVDVRAIADMGAAVSIISKVLVSKLSLSVTKDTLVYLHMIYGSNRVFLGYLFKRQFKDTSQPYREYFVVQDRNGDLLLRGKPSSWRDQTRRP
jgi:hypothetical protein